MYNVRYQGVDLKRFAPSGRYVDTVVLPVSSTSGPVELIKVDKDIDSVYNDYNNNISVNTAKKIFDYGYNLKCKRVIPWKKKYYKYGKGVLNPDTHEYEFTYIFPTQLNNCDYILIKAEDLRYNIFIWRSDKTYRSLPDAFGAYTKIIYSNNFFDQLTSIYTAIANHKFKLTKDMNKVTISRPSDVSNFYIEFGRYYEDIEYAGIRFFNRDYSFSSTNGVVKEVNSNYMIVANEGEELYISNPDTDNFVPVVEEGELVEVDQPLYLNFNYSYPNALKEYTDVDSFDNLKIEQLTTTNKTYSIKLYLDWYQKNPDKAIDVSQNAYLLVNNGIYNSLIWFADFESSEDFGIVVDKDQPQVKLAKVYSLRKYKSDEYDEDFAYTICINSNYEFELRYQHGIDEIRTEDYDSFNILATCTNYNEVTKEGSFYWERFGVTYSFEFSNINGLLKVTNCSQILDPYIKSGDVFDVLKYKYLQHKNPTFVYNGDLGDLIKIGTQLFGPKLPVIQSFDINPNYWYIDEFYDEESGIDESQVRENQITKLLEILKILGFKVEYDKDNLVVTLSSYDSLRIVDISDGFRITDYMNGSYDMICSIDDEYKIMDLWSKYPTSNPEIEVEFTINPLAEYTLTINKLNLNKEVIESERFLVSLDPNSSSYIINVLEANSNILSAKVYRYGLIKPGKYKLARQEDYSITELDLMCTLINMRLDEEPFEIFADGGILTQSCQFFVSNLLKDKYKLCLFDVYDRSKFDFSYVTRFGNTSYSYPHVAISGKIYPNYICFLEKSIKYNDYTGEVDIDRLVENPSQNDVSNLMSIYFDNYRYCITHNFISSDYGAIHPEIALIQSRIVNNIIYKVNYNTYLDKIIYQFNELIPQFKELGGTSLQDLQVLSIKQKDRTIYIDLLTVYNIFKADPIKVKVTLNFNIQ